MKIVAIVVTYNGMKWIEECLSSLYESSIPLKVFVIDNNSSDETVSLIKSKFPDVVLFEQKENLGFGKANNIGMSYALRQNADFVFLLNQDAFVNKNTIEELVRIAQRNPEYGVLSPIQLDNSGKLLETYFFRFMAEDNSRSFYSDFVLANSLKEVYDIDFIQAAAWLLPKYTLLKIGGFDPIFFHYGEDNNYCDRVLFHNLKIGIVSNSFVRHDSKIREKKHIDFFSVAYFKMYQLSFLVKYCNINVSFTQKEIDYEIRKIYIKSFKKICKLNFKSGFRFYKYIRFVKEIKNAILESRTKNAQENSNYLNGE